MEKHKTRNKLSKLKIKHNELLTISLSEKKLRRYKIKELNNDSLTLEFKIDG